jgi:dihydroflavonol-4-reductase
MTVLITGATGCIGGALATALVADGVRVRALVRSGSDSTLLEAAGVERADGDVRDRDAVRAAVRGCTQVVHLAAQRTAGGVPASVYRDVNVGGTGHIVEAAKEQGVSRLVFASTIGVHGFDARLPVDEQTALRPNSPYRLTKCAAEEVVNEARGAGLSAIILRISSTVGPGAKQWLPYCRLVEAGGLRLIGGGANATEVVALDDLVDAIRLALGAPDSASGTYALGGGVPLSARDLAARIADALQRPLPRRGPPALPYRLAMRAASVSFRRTGRFVVSLHEREPLVASLRVSIARARAQLGYAPRGDIDGALRAMVAGFRADGTLGPGGSPA